MNEPYLRGPWNAERLWYPRFAGQAASIVPPIANLAEGPAGFTYDTGTGLLPRYRRHFFLADFHGDASSLVHTFTLTPQGASFALADREDFLRGCLVTDVEIGLDGGLYVSDWVQGWKKTGRGRLYRIGDPRMRDDPLVRSTREILGQGMTARSLDELASLLGHADQRVRQEAQFELAARGAPAREPLAAVARGGGPLLARLHAIWGLGQLARTQGEALAVLRPLLQDGEAEVRAQAAHVLGDVRDAGAAGELARGMRDESARVRFYAAMAIARLRAHDAFDDVVAFLRASADDDPYLRHAGVMALVAIAGEDRLLALGRDRSFGVRLAALLALRRLASPRVDSFLGDPDPQLVLEAARAIHDVPIPEAMPSLAALIDRGGLAGEPLIRRVLNANFRIGGEREQERLAAFAGRESSPAAMRCEALAMLRDWVTPCGRDRIMGEWRPLPARDGRGLPALVTRLDEQLASAPDDVREEFTRLCAQHQVRAATPRMFAWLADLKSAPSLRVGCLDALATLAPDRLPEAVQMALADPQPSVGRRGCELLEQLAPDLAMPRIEHALETGSIPVQQGALHALGRLTDPRAEQSLSARFDSLVAGSLRPELRLDVVEAARASAAPAVSAKVLAYDQSFPEDDALAPFQVCLEGGDAGKGERIFFDKAEVSCLRCHQVRDRGGKIGPPLDGVGTRRTREQLLTSVLDPNREIVEGYGKVLLFLRKGGFQEGRIIAETESSLRLMGDDGAEVEVPRAEISERRDAFSAMPENMRSLLSKVELRDLIEFLASLK
jgi:quinoprotein glucose dehydrogenase